MKAKSFSLRDQDGNKRSLKDYKGSYLVLYFYPKDFTSGCTKEAEAFRDAATKLDELGAVVVGVSKDSVESHKKFADKHALPFTLLSDPDLAATKRYEAFGTKNMYGKVTEGVKRSTFLIGPDGSLLNEWRNVRVAGHVEKVIEALEQAQPA
ncbi:MAG: peroxiredoxin [Myxococcota bacterium]